MSSWIVFSLLSLIVNYIVGQGNYFIDSQENCNNVYGAVPNATASTQWVRYLGKCSSTEECMNACLKNSTINKTCQSYSYYTSSFDQDITYSMGCFGRFGIPYGLLWTPFNQENVNCGRIIYECESDLDCSLNGKCDINTGNCTCQTGWYGYHCNQLNLLPAIKGTGYHITNDNDSGMPTSSWGGAVLMDTSNNANNNTKYHMFLAEFDNHCGVNSWTINSVVTHAQSTNGYNSPYKRVQVIHEHFAHEPDAIRGPNGEIVLYYSAYNFSSNISECECTDGSTPPCSKPRREVINIMQYAESNNFNGPWYRTVIFPTRPTTDYDTNLAGIITPNGTFVGLFRIWTSGSEIFLVTSNDWKNGSLYIHHMNNELFPQLTGYFTEDPFVYIDCNGYYHAIFHNMSPRNETVCGGHAFSIDGINWIYGGSSYDNNVQFTDNTNFTFTRRERPHFIFAEDKCTPIALTNGAEYGGKYGDATYTVLQPVKH